MAMATIRSLPMRLLAALTLLALLLPALARPWLAPVPVPMAYGAVCTAQGLAIPADAPGLPSPAHDAWAHCPWCLLPLDLALPASASPRWQAWVSGGQGWPRAHAGLLPKPAAAASPLPRGPPTAAA